MAFYTENWVVGSTVRFTSPIPFELGAESMTGSEFLFVGHDKGAPRFIPKGRVGTCTIKRSTLAAAKIEAPKA